MIYQFRKINFKEGSGTAVIGLYVMLFCMTMGIMFMGIYQKNEYKHEMQTAADTVADGVAVYMASNGGTYEDAKNEMRRLETLTYKYTGVDYRTLDLNKNQIENNNIADVDATVFLRDIYTRYNYRIAANAATEYKPHYDFGDDAYIQLDVTSIYFSSDPDNPDADQKIILASDLEGYDLNNDGTISDAELATTLERIDGTGYRKMKYGASGEWKDLTADNINEYYGTKGYVEWMVAVANDNSHGYSIPNRYFNPDIDCSSFVYYALTNNGYHFGGFPNSPFSTGDMPQALKGVGFQQIPFSRDNVQVGDILWHGPNGGKYGHTGVCCAPGMQVAANNSRGHPAAGDQTGTEVSVQPIVGGYTHIFRMRK